MSSKELGSFSLAPGHMGPTPHEVRVTDDMQDEPVLPPSEYYRRLAGAESILEAAALGPEPVFDSLAEAAAVQPDLIALSEGDTDDFPEVDLEQIDKLGLWN